MTDSNEEELRETLYILELEAENERLRERVEQLADFGAANHITLDLLRQGIIGPNAPLVFQALQMDCDL